MHVNLSVKARHNFSTFLLDLLNIYVKSFSYLEYLSLRSILDTGIYLQALSRKSSFSNLALYTLLFLQICMCIWKLYYLVVHATPYLV